MDLVQCSAEPLIAAWSNGLMVVSDYYNGIAASFRSPNPGVWALNVPTNALA